MEILVQLSIILALCMCVLPASVPLVPTDLPHTNPVSPDTESAITSKTCDRVVDMLETVCTLHRRLGGMDVPEHALLQLNVSKTDVLAIFKVKCSLQRCSLRDFTDFCYLIW